MSFDSLSCRITYYCCDRTVLLEFVVDSRRLDNSHNG